jgi:succinate dehydrogenase / fumarate reductase cytochrome b subunit
MAYFFTSSIGKKLLISVTGLFLILFLLEHLAVNLLIVFDSSGNLFNQAAHMLETNPIIRIIEPVLLIGFILHIILTMAISIQNQIQLGKNHSGFKRYKVRESSAGSSWISRNMIILGTFVLAFLVVHLINFFWKMRFSGDLLLAEVVTDGVVMKNAYALVVATLSHSYTTVVIYVIGAIALGLHLYHGVWSAFQTIGLSNKKWRRILNVIGILFSILVAVGYAFIPLFIMIRSIV